MPFDFDASTAILALALLCAGCAAAVRAAPIRSALARKHPPGWARGLEMAAQAAIPLFLVLAFRVALYEPFRIPSGSMKPGMDNGDFILVDKHVWGIKAPLLSRPLLETGSPALGDIAVFKYPPNPSMAYIKRIVGLPGDSISYARGQLSINGSPARYAQESPDSDEPGFRFLDETLPGGAPHRIRLGPEATTHYPFASSSPHCKNNPSIPQFTCVVPPGHYFAMGDNRDNSADSRFWGFVPESHLIGKAGLIWLSLSNPSRIGSLR